jgi:hypothetical protein
VQRQPRSEGTARRHGRSLHGIPVSLVSRDCCSVEAVSQRGHSVTARAIVAPRYEDTSIAGKLVSPLRPVCVYVAARACGEADAPEELPERAVRTGIAGVYTDNAEQAPRSQERGARPASLLSPPWLASPWRAAAENIGAVILPDGVGAAVHRGGRCERLSLLLHRTPRRTEPTRSTWGRGDVW